MIIPSIAHLQAFVCKDIDNCRTLFQIVWSCVSVLIACTWVSVHPNLRGPDDGSWEVFRRKIGLMIIALIAPEMLVFWAARQWYAARKLSEHYPGWSRTHAFFALMGGFALYKGKDCVSVLRFIPLGVSGGSESHRHIMGNFEDLGRSISDDPLSIHSETIQIPLTTPVNMSSDGDLKQSPVVDNEVDHPLAASHTADKHESPVSSHNNNSDTIVISTDSNLMSGIQTEEALASSFTGEELNNDHTTGTDTSPILYIAGKLAECHGSQFDQRSFAAHVKLIARISEAEIEGRSHSDGFSKLVAVMQTTWFVVQLFARWIEGLPVTELEVMTLDFAAMNVLISFFWWDKPQGVGSPVRIVRKTGDEDVMDLVTDQSSASPQQNVGWMLFTWICLCHFLRQVPDILFYVLVSPLVIIVQIGSWAGALYDMIAEDNPYIRDSERAVLSFEQTTDLEPKNAQDKFIAYSAAVMFGAIHCAAWISKFPSTAEEVLWKVCSLVVTCVPMYMALHNIIEKKASNLPDWVDACLFLVYIITVFFYVLARLSLIVQPFVALRDLPPGILKAVQWTNFIPHI
ncbi:hypothetical protein GYMLUDRAFT_922704 [Collybiopsis luxurians FD-317 M1]|uniref:Uncharacterized protein n=1 Tax=Collybiopsis luxurians FD-317 M1 TaxID=944289 RepID=A0A0D0C7N1_9AGAR|nr:hypothetical protein GYMLUDRAFT_922704 [Collybiopsis luxurians FD-317 M1]